MITRFRANSPSVHPQFRCWYIEAGVQLSGRWDCWGPRGLLEAVYRNLGIPQKAWQGLKCLPDIGGLSDSSCQSYIQLVRACFF